MVEQSSMKLPFIPSTQGMEPDFIPINEEFNIKLNLFSANCLNSADKASRFALQLVKPGANE